MKLPSNLVYRKSTGKVIGYTEMGDLNGEISEFFCSVLQTSSRL